MIFVISGKSYENFNCHVCPHCRDIVGKEQCTNLIRIYKRLSHYYFISGKPLFQLSNAFKHIRIFFSKLNSANGHVFNDPYKHRTVWREIDYSAVGNRITTQDLFLLKQMPCCSGMTKLFSLCKTEWSFDSTTLWCPWPGACWVDDVTRGRGHPLK